MAEITLISFDGIPGSSKSSTALWLGAMLEKKGVPVRVIPENKTPHPVRFVTDLIHQTFCSLAQEQDHCLVLKNPALNWIASRRKIWSFCSRHIFQRSFFNDFL